MMPISSCEISRGLYKHVYGLTKGISFFIFIICLYNDIIIILLRAQNNYWLKIICRLNFLGIWQRPVVLMDFPSIPTITDDNFCGTQFRSMAECILCQLWLLWDFRKARKLRNGEINMQLSCNAYICGVHGYALQTGRQSSSNIQSKPC